MADYVPFTSPQLSNPFLQGLTNIQQVNDANAARQSDLERMLIARQQERANLERYQGQTPGVLAKSDLERQLADNARLNPNYAPTMTAGDMGKAQSSQAAGALAMGGLPSALARTVAENEAGGAEARGKQLGAGADIVQRSMPLLQAAANEGPLAQEMAYQRLLPQLPADLRQALPSRYTPQVDNVLNTYINNSVNSIGQQQKTGQEKVKTESAERIAKGHDATQLEIAKIRNAERRKDLMQSFQTAKTPEQVATYGQLLLDDPEVSSMIKDRIKNTVEQAQRLVAYRAARGQFEMPGGQLPGIRDIAPKIKEDVYPPTVPVPGSPIPGQGGVNPFQTPTRAPVGTQPSMLPTVPNRPTNLPPVNAQGWILNTDKKGRQAYVSPDGKQFKEVQ